jgi:OmpA-OmpF porin, OOP family
VPTLVSALMNTASTNEGAQQLARTLDTGKYDGSALNSVTSLFGGGMTTQSALGAGRGILDSLFGSKLSGVSDLIARFAGVRAESATSLLALAAPLVMHVIGQQRAASGSDAYSLARLLGSQKDLLTGLLPAGLGSLLGWSGVTSGVQEVGSSVAGAASRVAHEVASAPSAVGRQNWLAPLLILGALALGTLLWLSWPTSSVREAARRISELQLPGGVRISVPEGSFNFSLANWLAGTTDTRVPKRFVFDNLNFERDSTKLTPESISTVNTLMTVLTAYPGVSVALEGHTDSTGDPSANKKLSLDRADAVVKSQRRWIIEAPMHSMMSEPGGFPGW